LWHYVNDPCKIIVTIILVSMFSSCWSWHKKCIVIVLFLELPFAEWHSYGVCGLAHHDVGLGYSAKLFTRNFLAQDEMYLLNHDKTEWYDHSVVIKPVLYKCTGATLVCIILLALRVFENWSNRFYEAITLVAFGSYYCVYMW